MSSSIESPTASAARARDAFASYQKFPKRAAVKTPSIATAPSHGLEGLKRPTEFRILVIDEEELGIAVICGHLENEGYQHLTATTDPLSSLQIIETAAIDLVLFDINMESMNGLDLLRTIRVQRDAQALPVIILTAAEEDEMRIKALELGATDFLRKPLNRFELFARIRNTLALKAHQDRMQSQTDTLEEAVRQRTEELEASRMEVIECLARAAEFCDDDTGNHVLRVGRYARIIGEELGLSREFLDHLEPAAQLHDVGKIGIPDDILLKSGKLSDDEHAYMRKHCGFGKRVIKPLTRNQSATARGHAELGATIMSTGHSPILELASRIAVTHHEKWDGSGYPLGLSGDNIPIEGRITAVADVFDALSSRRPYKDAFPLDRCLAILREESGSHFDPKCVNAFFARIEDIVSTQIELAETE